MYDFLLIVSLVVFAATVIAYLRHPAASLAHPASFYLVFHGFVFVLRPFVARYYEFDFVYRLYDFQPSMDDKITVILGANLAMLVFVATTLWIGSRPARPVPREQADRMRAKLFWPIIVSVGLFTPLALYSQLGSWVSRSNHFETMVRDAATGNMVNIQGNGWFTDSALMMAPMAVMMVWLSRYRWWGWAYFAGFAFLQAGTGTRHAIIFAFAAVAIGWLLERDRKWFDWRAVVLALVAAVAFNQIVVDRGGAVRSLIVEDMGPDYIDEQSLDPLEHMDFASLEYFEYIVYAVPQRTGTYDYFAHVLQVFTEPVPRVLWEEKPVGSPVKMFSLWDYGRPVGMTASMPGIGWMSLGYPGIIIQSAIFALIFGGLYRYLLVSRASALARLAYSLAIAMTVLGFRDGTLLTLLRTFPFYFGPLVVALLLARFAFGPYSRATIVPQADTARNFLEQTPAERRKALAARSLDGPARRVN
ncbi:hypothetical protein K3163_11670 [Qipengyuania sp. 1NDW9]|uniref:hypothetical protein n=1 Tax=Qipengyuania xiapuensis TaxID=2867236 RepID=UPI001C878377|nr:hypothetical protein [Qipengyuania xiapuensis]MBX7493864.1 hypothetical protein [Qipengyuania xiapuensis]